MSPTILDWIHYLDLPKKGRVPWFQTIFNKNLQDLLLPGSGSEQKSITIHSFNHSQDQAAGFQLPGKHPWQAEARRVETQCQSFLGYTRFKLLPCSLRLMVVRCVPACGWSFNVLMCGFLLPSRWIISFMFSLVRPDLIKLLLAAYWDIPGGVSSSMT